MGITATAKEFCCTWDGQYRLKKLLSMICGVLVILSSVFALLNIVESVFNPLQTIQTCWNILFGVLMLLHEFHMTSWITLRFGFLNGWFGRGMFYLFVGTIIMGKPDKQGFWNVFSYVVGFACIFIGAIELLFGFKCATSETAQADSDSATSQLHAANADAAKKKGWFGGGERAPTAPTDNNAVTINVTPGQVASAAGWAANNASTVAAVANAAAPAAPSTSAANPFFGNSHLGNQQ
ncbi:hypothetical protein AB1Y20_019011 [Prymnesium parvum]|uniref:COPI associated protein n=1 Tax=Prymnesium parvum TaxID=97485 RepID=A0AB34JTX7_PRYPA